MNKIFVLSFVAAIMLSATVIMAAGENTQIPLQGRLSDAGGKPLDGTYTMTFKLYTDAEAGTLLWSETQTVTVTKGMFNAWLGGVTPFGAGVKFDAPYYVEITVKKGTKTETLSPRFALAASPYVMAKPVIPTAFSADAITSGVLNIARIPDMDASKITSGTLDGNVLTIKNVPAANIKGYIDLGSQVTGTLPAARVSDIAWDKLIGTIPVAKIASGAITNAMLNSDVKGCSLCTTCGGSYTVYGGKFISVAGTDEDNFPTEVRGKNCAGSIAQNTNLQYVSLCCAR
jgi:hypothetical protein